MSTETKSLDFENQWLNTVLGEIRLQLKEKNDILDEHKSDLVKTNRAMWEDISSSGPESLMDLERMVQAKFYIDELKMKGWKYEFAGKLRDKLEKMLLSPYFGRIDFCEEDELTEERVYLGIATLADSNGDFYVYDWRAPVSSMFYDYEIGPAQYLCPAGSIKGELRFKRQYRIYKDEIEFMFDSSLKIDDVILQEALSKNLDTKMKTIVTTIQREQNAIIRDEAHRLLIVQGTAGSGKTSVALHRIAYILYKYRESTKPENIVIFSPNRIFNDYISDVLPELGEENMKQTTFMEYAIGSLDTDLKPEGLLQQMEYLLTSSGDEEYALRLQSIKYKTSNEYLELMKSYVGYMEKKWDHFEDISFNKKLVISRQELKSLYSNDYSRLKAGDRLGKLRQRIYYLLRPFEEERQAQIEEELRNSPEYIEEYHIEGLARKRLAEELLPVHQIIDRLSSFDIISCYRKLLTDRRLLSLISNGSSFELNAVADFTIKQLSRGYIPYEDIISLVYLRGALGYLPNHDSIRHVVIDEMQDYTPMQLQIVKQLFPYSSFTMLGDINQAINPQMNTVKPADIMTAFKIESSATVVLDKSYRSTKEISEFARAILNDESKIYNVNRKGSKPRLIKVKDSKAHSRAVSSDIKTLKEEGYNSIAVICRSAKEAQEAYSNLKDQVDVRFVADDEKEFKLGTVVIPSYLTKGLEFDAALIYDAGNKAYNDTERRLFYTLCTRALHQLYIYYSNNPTDLIKSINPALYEAVER